MLQIQEIATYAIIKYTPLLIERRAGTLSASIHSPAQMNRFILLVDTLGPAVLYQVAHKWEARERRKAEAAPDLARSLAPDGAWVLSKHPKFGAYSYMGGEKEG
jgi:hypothetical protein